MPDRFNRLREFMDEAIEKSGFPGIDCIIYQDHNEIFRHSSGFMDLENKIPPVPRALYNIYSATKMVTCIAALQLVEQGRMLLTDPLHKYLPEYEHMQVKYGTFSIAPARNKIRIADLFAMTAGLSYESGTPHLTKLKEDTEGDYTTREFAAALAKEPLLFEPGEGWNYGFCHDVLAVVIEEISGKTFGQYLQDNILAPLGMKDACFYVPDSKKDRIAPQYTYDKINKVCNLIENTCLAASPGGRFESGGGGLVMSAEDYILFIDALACGGIGKNGAKIISPPSIALMGKNQLRGKAMEDFRKAGASEGHGYSLGSGVVYDTAAGLSFRPEGSFSWGGIGGVQNLVDPKNRLSYYVSQHLIAGGERVLGAYMINILYGLL
ncbi:MAG: beta-lactamase family protein [Firmicutes bacterium]|nr:beta-lactamase family protein [Bacillota bacterium]